MATLKLALFYGHAASNFGDLAINQGTVNLLRAANPDARLNVVLLDSSNSEYLQEAKSSFGDDGMIQFSHLASHGERALTSLYDPADFLKQLGVDDADVVLLAAGEHLFRYAHGENSSSLFWRAFPAYAAKIAGMRCVVLPSSFGPFEDSDSNSLVSALAGIVDGIAARDLRSQTLLKSRFGLADAPLLLDPAFFVEDGAAEQAGRSTGGTGITALVMRSEGWGIRLSKQRKTAMTEGFEADDYRGSRALQFSLALCARILTESRGKIRIVVQTVADAALANALVRQLGHLHERERIEICRPLSVADYLVRLSDVDRVVGSRFHALIMGLVAGKPVHGAYFDAHGHKIPGLFDLLGAARGCVNLSTTSPESAAQAIWANFAHEQATLAGVRSRLKGLRAETTDWLGRMLRRQSKARRDPASLLSAANALGHFAAELARSSITANATRKLEAAKKAARAEEDRVKADRTALEAELNRAQDEARDLGEAAKAAQQQLAAEKAALEANLNRAQTEARKQGEAAKALQHRFAAEKAALEAELAKVLIEAHDQGEAAKALQNRFAAEKAALEAELAKVRIEVHDQGEAAKALQNRFAAEKAALESELAEARAGAARLGAEQSALNAKMVNAQQEHERLARMSAMQSAMHQRTVASLENRALGVKQTFSYRLGNLLIDGTRSPAAFARLGVDLWRLHLEAKKRAAAPGGKAIAEMGGRTFQKVIEEYARGGFSAVEALLAGMRLSPHVVASAYTALARHLQSIDPRNAVQAAKRSYEADPQGFRAKWLAFRMFDAGVITESATLLDALPDNVEFSPSELKRVDEIRAYARLRAAKPELPQGQEPAYIPVASSLLYVAASSLPYHTTGYTTRTHALVQALVRSGVKLTVMTRPGYPWDRRDRSGAPSEPRTNVDGIVYHHVRHPSQDLQLDLYLQEAASAIAAVAMKQRVAAIHAASNYVNALPALIAARRLGIPFHYEMRGLWELTRASKVPEYEDTERFKLGAGLEAFVATNADRVHAISPQLAEYVQLEWGVKVELLSLLPNCINTEDFKDIVATVPESFTVGYAGSLVPYEGLDVLIDAVKLLAGRGLHILVKILGDGESRPGLEKRVKDLGLVDQIEFQGTRTPADARQALAGVSAVCIPRKAHKICELVPPIKLVEAMALGKPVIVPDLAAFRCEIVDGATGYFFKVGDSRDLSRVIERCAVESDAAAKVGSAARDEALANRTWARFAQDTLASLETPVASGTPPAVLAAPHSFASGASGLMPKPDDSVYVTDFRHAGADQVIERVARTFSSNARNCARELLRVGRLLGEAGCEGAEYALALEALKFERSDPILRGAFWAAQRAKKFELAFDIVCELEALYGSNPSEAQAKFLEKLKRSPACELADLRLIVDRHPPTIRSIPQRIAYVLHNSLPYSSGGYAARSHGMAEGLRGVGFEIYAFTRPGFPVDIKPELQGTELDLVSEIEGIHYVRTLSPLRMGRSSVTYVREAADVFEARFREFRPALVMAASNYVVALPALIAARRLGIPFIYEIRGLWEVTRASRDQDFLEKAAFDVQKVLEASVANRSDHVFTLTEPLREELVSRGVAPERIDLLPNSCDPSRFRPRERDAALASSLNVPSGVPVIGYVGTFVDYEGLEDLATACVRLKNRGIDFRLLLVGNENASGESRGPITELVGRIAEEGAMGDWLIMPGRVPHDKVESYYSLIDIAPFPRKPWPVCEMVSPLKPLEALAMEKAVVVSSVRALKEMITDGETGMVFEKGSIESLAETLGRLIADAGLRDRLGKAGRKWVEEERTWLRRGREAAKVISALTSQTAGNAGPRMAVPSDARVLEGSGERAARSSAVTE